MVSSLNAAVPPAVERLAADLAPDLAGVARRERLSLLLKRLPEDDPTAEKRVRRALRGAPAVEARVSGIEVFEDPPAGPAPVVYLAVESPGLHELHRRLCEAVDPVPGLEGPDYTPHVTLGRGDDDSLGPDRSAEVARRLAGRDVGPVTWTVESLHFLDARYGEPTGRIPLPA